MDNVNNLNGIPNFGHGWEEQPSLDEVELTADTKKVKKKK